MKAKAPDYCYHRTTGQSYVTVRRDGKRIQVYFGKWGSPESVTLYENYLRQSGLPDGVIRKAVEQASASVVAPDTPPPLSHPDACTVRSLWAAFFRWAEGYYRLPTGAPSRELNNFRDAVRELLDLYGDHRAAALTKADPERVRDKMIERKLSRGVINRRVNKIVRVFVWGTEEQRGLVPESVAATLKLIRRLEAHRSPAKDYPPVLGVDPRTVEKAAKAANPVIAAMMRLQLLTGMRPGEVRGLRKGMVAKVEGQWAADFGIEHKMAYRKQSRVVALGPKAMTLLRPWLKLCPTDEFVFRPTQQKGSRGNLGLTHYEVVSG